MGGESARLVLGSMILRIGNETNWEKGFSSVTKLEKRMCTGVFVVALVLGVWYKIKRVLSALVAGSFEYFFLG